MDFKRLHRSIICQAAALLDMLTGRIEEASLAQLFISGYVRYANLADEASAKDPGPLPRLEGLFQHIQQQLPWRSQKLSRSIAMWVHKSTTYLNLTICCMNIHCFPGVDCPFISEHPCESQPNREFSVSLRSRVARWRCRVLVLLAKAKSWSNGHDYIRLPCHSQSKKSKKDEAEATACEIVGHIGTSKSTAVWTQSDTTEVSAVVDMQPKAKQD